jgi:glycerol-3-phosphate dehydrogenase
VLVGPSGVVTVVGGKLTTYRRMAQDAVDRAVAVGGLRTGGCRTRRLPLLGAGTADELAAVPAPGRLVRRYGTEAALVLEAAQRTSGLTPADLSAEAVPGLAVTLAELLFGVTHEGAVTVDDLLDRRTRVGLIPEDRARLVPAAEQALRLARAGDG